jgi:hypothetical protein
MFLFRYKKNGLPLSLIRVHDAFLKDTIKHFEKGKDIRIGFKKARKAVKKALSVAKKKNISPGIEIGEAREELERIKEELEYTLKSLSITYSNLHGALKRIQEERIENPLAIINNAHEFLRNKEIEKGIEALRQSQDEMKKKILIETRTALFGGTSNEVTNLKIEIMDIRKRRHQGKNQ